MLLSCRMLENVVDANHFNYVQAMEFTEGDTPRIFLQLIDASLDKAIAGFSPAGRRYMPDIGATLKVTFDNLDDAKKITRTAIQPFASDPSIWMIDLLTTDKVVGTITLRLALTEGIVTTSGNLRAAIRVCVNQG
ncbi:hypothetical protein UFOVP75_77 [uncultured Caudovirales phage]|uniref:Uncharacterized protein n=1 Tax=uncultured Caudovirales phage TaxID=2100421 RepID=A0A6J5KXG5_9CAUD|nr:hypothetical protein UFOVP75_77 [uncultured Caudovirales phage]